MSIEPAQHRQHQKGSIRGRLLTPPRDDTMRTVSTLLTKFDILICKYNGSSRID